MKQQENLPFPLPKDTTALILSGGQGLRMGGVDKGWQLWQGEPLITHVVRRLAPQVGKVLISANRNTAAYAALGFPVVGDSLAGFAGPLAGLQAGLHRAKTRYLLTAPCDAPFLPLDLQISLAKGMAKSGASLVVAASKRGMESVFLLCEKTLSQSVDNFLQDGGRKLGDWIRAVGGVAVPFDDLDAFANLNTLEELAAFKVS